MNQTEYLNNLIKAAVAKADNCVLFGQNINAGSCLGGLTRGIKVKPSCQIINSTNAENSLVGFGFGLMMNGASGVFFMKQLDFLLLGIDQLVNTYNIIRSINHQPINGSFTIVPVVVDSGYEGPQSSFNNLYDLCSIARIPGYTVTNKADTDYFFEYHFMKPGFRIIALSQRLGKTEQLEATPMKIIDNGSIFQYSDGKDVSIVSFNFSFPQAFKLNEFLKKNGIQSSHFHVNSAIATNWQSILESVRKTRKIVTIDDSKSAHTPVDSFLAEVGSIDTIKKIVLKRKLNDDWLHPVSDIFEIDEEKIVCELLVSYQSV